MSRTTSQDLQLFAALNANHPHLLAWLKAEREEAVSFMTKACDLVIVHRAQGDVQRIDKIIDLLMHDTKRLRP